mgnify:CR=1 FL=1
MENNFEKIQELLREKADFQARLKLIAYDGTPEIKEVSGKKYLYVRKELVAELLLPMLIFILMNSINFCFVATEKQKTYEKDNS